MFGLFLFRQQELHACIAQKFYKKVGIKRKQDDRIPIKKYPSQSSYIPAEKKTVFEEFGIEIGNKKPTQQERSIRRSHLVRAQGFQGHFYNFFEHRSGWS